MQAQIQEFEKAIQAFPRCRIGVVGDLVGDLYIYGTPTRLSREAPVMIIRHEREDFFLGGAANTVNNLCSLGSRVAAVGVVGADALGDRLVQALEKRGVRTDGVVRSPRWRTISKNRVLAGDYHTKKQQVLRLDYEPERSLDAQEGELVRRALVSLREEVDAWIISDYGYGTLSLDTLKLLQEEAHGGKLVVADSRYRVKEFRGLTLVTPNELEALSAYGISRIYNEHAARDIVMDVGARLVEDLALSAALITRGDQGMILFERGQPPLDIPISGTADIVDVSGAGDTVVATATLALVAGGGFASAARLANLAAGIVVMKPGTASATVEELKTAVRALNHKAG